MKSENTTVARIIDFINTEGLVPGAHLPAQLLADRLQVSRSPINNALVLMCERGLVKREANRGYFLAASPEKVARKLRRDPELKELDPAKTAYEAIAEDLLQGRMPMEVTEVALKTQYGLTQHQLTTVLSRIAQEGWGERKPGYGWRFSAMLTTPDSLLQSYRLRLALEPAALREPGYKIDPRVLERCRQAERHLLEGGIETDTPEQLHERGVRFHEAIVEASGNPFFIETIRRVNRVRRLLSYRSMKDRRRYEEHCRQHLEILDLLAEQRQEEAAKALELHLLSTLRNVGKISDLLRS